jgi:hypothetical protein
VDTSSDSYDSTASMATYRHQSVETMEEMYERTTTFLTLGNDILGNSLKTVAKSLICNGILRVAKFRHFVY